jgi:hypothetical protein
LSKKSHLDIHGRPSHNSPKQADSGIFSINYLIVQPCLPGDKLPYMEYGNYTGYEDTQCPGMGGSIGADGIEFRPQGTPTNGKYSFVQIVNKDVEVYSASAASLQCTTQPGLDGRYPYPSPDGYASDSPNVPLEFPSWIKVRRSFAATMYLMWTSSSDPKSIPVPIGYQKWTLQETTKNPGAPTSQGWTKPVSNSHGADGDFVPASPGQSAYGYPTWNRKATFICPHTPQTVGKQELEEEQ